MRRSALIEISSTSLNVLLKGTRPINNEAVANTLAAAAGTTSRKMAERVRWWYYVVVPEKDLSDAATLANADPRSSKMASFKLTY